MPQPPVNDNFASATSITGSSGAKAGTNVRATRQSGEPLLIKFSSATTTVWWKWTAPVSGTATFSTVGSAFDTQMGIYTGSSLSSLSLVKADDDRGANRTSICTFTCTSGRTYYICVGGYNGATGAITLRWSTAVPQPPVNDNFASATLITGTSGAKAGTNVRATRQSGEPLLNSYSTATTTVWWKWTAPVSGSATFSTVGSAFDTQMGIYTGSSLSSLSMVKVDDNRGANRTSICTFTCTSGRTYYICVGGYNGATGAITLRWSTMEAQPPVNDSFASATSIAGTSGTKAGSNVKATCQSGEPLLNSYSSATTTVWWKWTAPVSGSATFSTVGSAFDTQMGVYTGSSLSSLSLVKADDDRGANRTSICTFTCTSGRTYYICVGGYRGATGAITLRWSTMSR